MVVCNIKSCTIKIHGYRNGIRTIVCLQLYRTSYGNEIYYYGNFTFVEGEPFRWPGPGLEGDI